MAGLATGGGPSLMLMVPYLSKSFFKNTGKVFSLVTTGSVPTNRLWACCSTCFRAQGTGYVLYTMPPLLKKYAPAIFFTLKVRRSTPRPPLRRFLTCGG